MRPDFPNKFVLGIKNSQLKVFIIKIGVKY
jgi:hypothetical protein